jgi:hypothetical protein
MSKQVYLSDRGDDRNDGLTLETAVLTTDAHAVTMALKEKTPSFYVTGGDSYRRRVNAELEARKKK